MKRLFINVTFLVVLVSCGSLNEEEVKLTGEWQALWLASPEAYSDVPGHIKLNMDGKITFNDRHKVIISGYGYPGCVFAEDTIENELSWELKEGMIKLFNEKDSFIMEYKIELLSEDTASFLFMDDIQILLKKSRY